MTQQEAHNRLRRVRDELQAARYALGRAEAKWDAEAGTASAQFRGKVTLDEVRPAALHAQGRPGGWDCSRETNAACSGLARPCWRTRSTATPSIRTMAAESSHRPGKTSLRRMPSGPGERARTCPGGGRTSRSQG